MISVATLGETLGAALRDVWPALRSWIWWLVAIVIVTVGALILAALLNPPTDAPAPTVSPYEIEATLVCATGLIAAACFAVASAVRTVRPEFRMTAGRFFGFLGWSLLGGLMTLLAALLLIIPGLYVLVKVSQAPYLCLLGDAGNPIEASFTITRGHFWLTVLALIVVSIVSELVSYAGGVVVGLLAVVGPVPALIATPIALAVFLVSLQFSYNAYVRWADALRSAAGLTAA